MFLESELLTGQKEVAFVDDSDNNIKLASNININSYIFNELDFRETINKLNDQH